MNYIKSQRTVLGFSSKLLSCLVLLFPIISFAAIGFDSATNGSRAYTSPLVWTHTTSGTNTIGFVTAYSNRNGDVVNPPTWGGQTMTLVSKLNNTNNSYIYIYGIINPPSGAQTISLPFTSNANAVYGMSASYNGVSQSGQPNVVVTNSALSVSSLSTNLNTLTDNSWTILLGQAEGNNGSLSAGTGSTQRVVGDFGFIGLYDSNSGVTPAGQKTMSYNSSGPDNLGAIMLSIAPASGGSTPPPSPVPTPSPTPVPTPTPAPTPSPTPTPTPSGPGSITSITGSLSHGSIATISGTGFGIKNVAAPVKYDDFQTGSSMIANGWQVEGFHKPIFSATDLRSGTPFNRNMECRFERGINFNVGGDACSISLKGLAQTTYILDYWYKAKWNANGTTIPHPQNIKPWRLHQLGAESSNLYMGWNVGGGGSIGDWLLIGQDLNFGNGSQPNNMADYNTTIPYSMSTNQWVHQTVLVKVGTPGGNNGSLMVYTNGGNGGRTWWMGNFPMLTSGETNWPEIYFGNYVRSDDHADVYMNWESIYFDNSWSRVEIGNSSSYTGSTHREIQIPQSWSSSSIAFKLNRGSFATGSTVYVFVIDNNNNVINSSGYPITIASDGGVTPPPPPTPTPTPVPGDLNVDRVVNSLDWSIMNSQWFSSNSQSDLRVDGQVNSLDFAILSSNWGRTW